MTNTIEFKIKDDGVDKIFVAKKFNVIEYLDLIDTLLEIFCTASIDGIDSDIIKGLIGNITQNGKGIDNIKNVINDNNVLEIIVKILVQGFARSGKKVRFDIIGNLISQCKYIGISFAPADVSLNLTNINNILTNYTSIYKICFEVLKLNFPKLGELTISTLDSQME